MLYRIKAKWREGEYPLVVANGSDPLCAAVALLNLFTTGCTQPAFSVEVFKSENVTLIEVGLRMLPGDVRSDNGYRKETV